MSESKRKSFAEKRAELMKNPKFVAAYESVREEYQLASAMIHARKQAGLTQAQVAERMGVDQSYVAKLESGKRMPPTKTLQSYAKATGTHLRIAFEANPGQQAHP